MGASESISPDTDCASCRRNSMSKFRVISVKSYTMKGYTMALLLLVTTFMSVCSAQNMKLDIGETLRQQDLNKGTVEFQDPVALQWGIADTSTNVGKMFNFVIPSDAFRGTLHTIKVRKV